MPSRRVRFFSFVGLLTLCIWPEWANAQVERYELGRRLRVFEKAWNAASPTDRQRSTPALRQAVNQFFSFRLGEAGGSITEARYALDSKQNLTPEKRWGEAICLKVQSRFLDIAESQLNGTLAAFYQTKVPKPANAKWRITVQIGQAKPQTLAEGQINELPQEVTISLKDQKIPEGDHVFTTAIQVGQETMASSDQIISFADRLKTRLETLKQTTQAWSNPLDTPKATVKSLLELLEGFANRKRTLETDYPCAHLLKEVESATKAIEENKPYYDFNGQNPNSPGQYWLTIALPNQRLAYTRVLVPELKTKNKRLPLVIALHGAGGSENMFFESYGAGAIVELCQQRGWVLVAPRAGAFGSGPLPNLIDELAKRLPIDVNQVFLVGHSMGAGQAIAAALSSPQRYAGVAALGGGRSVRAVPGLEKLPFFVGVGTEDFALQGAQGLNQSLKKAGLQTLRYQEYPQIEHLAIAAAALPEVFRFFDKILAK